jgi:hypothetical protein
MNTHQVLRGARRPGLLDTYVVGLVAQIPTVTVTGSTVTFTGGQMEFDGRLLSLDGALDFSSFSTLLAQPPLGQATATSCYKVFAVPKYYEPLSRAEAEDPTLPYAASGINYYVSTDPNNKESYLHYFLPSYIEQMVNDAGGLEYLEYQYIRGQATGQEMRVYQQYYEEYNRTMDPAFIGRDFIPMGTDFVLAQVSPSPTIPDMDVTDNMTPQQLQYFLNSQHTTPSRLHNTVYTLTGPTTGTFFTGPVPTQPLGLTIPGTNIIKFRTIILYPSQADALANTNAFPVTFPEGLQDIVEAYAYVTSPAPDGLGWTSVFAMAWEYYIPGYLPPGQIGYKPQIHQFLTKRDHSLLGRVNPIYMADPFRIPRICSGLSRRPAMMDYACPSSLIDICLTVTAGNPPTVALNPTYTNAFDIMMS